MTREEELERLIAEQAADDTYVIRGESSTVNIDSVSNFLTTDDGGVVCNIPPRRGTILKPPIREDEPWHGTFDGYNNHRCRCARCRAFKAQKQREWRERKRSERHAA